jgi:hypothetical protein
MRVGGDAQTPVNNKHGHGQKLLEGWGGGGDNIAIAADCALGPHIYSVTGTGPKGAIDFVHVAAVLLFCSIKLRYFLQNILRRIYTQNIDALEYLAG